MIGITNENGLDDDPIGGEHLYSLWIYDGRDKHLIAEFTHFRRDGLAVCLRKAAEAAANKEDE
jgi:hypothetical protein